MELVLTSYRYKERELLEELKGLGDFEKTCFRDVIRGEVQDLEIFLEEIDKRNVFSLSRIVPVERSFQFFPDKVIEEFEEAVKPFIERIERGESFCVKIERRGLRESFSSQETARKIGTFVFEALKKRDREEPKVNLNDPDEAVIFETLGRWCGVGILSKKMREKYVYLKLP